MRAKKATRAMRIGLAGLGAGAVNALSASPGLTNHPNVELVAAADPRPEAREAFTRRNGGRTYANVEEHVQGLRHRRRLHPHAQCASRRARYRRCGARQAGHRRQAYGAYAGRLRCHDPRRRTQRRPAIDWPFAKSRQRHPEDGRDRPQRRAGTADHDRLELLQRVAVPASQPRRARSLHAGGKSGAAPRYSPAGYRADAGRRHRTQRPRRNRSRRSSAPHRRRLCGLPGIR